MSQIRMLLSVTAILSLAFLSPALAANPPAKGDVLPKINLSIPKSPDERSYLGLSEAGTFKIPQIKAI